jgi:hypothetical protein
MTTAMPKTKRSRAEANPHSRVSSLAGLQTACLVNVYVLGIASFIIFSHVFIITSILSSFEFAGIHDCLQKTVFVLREPPTQIKRHRSDRLEHFGPRIGTFRPVPGACFMR